MPRLLTLTALLVAVMSAHAQTVGQPYADAIRPYQSQAFRAHAPAAAPLFASPTSPSPIGELAALRGVTALRIEGTRIAVASPSEGVLGWVEAAALVRGEPGDEAPLVSPTAGQEAALREIAREVRGVKNIMGVSLVISLVSAAAAILLAATN